MPVSSVTGTGGPAPDSRAADRIGVAQPGFDAALAGALAPRPTPSGEPVAGAPVTLGQMVALLSGATGSLPGPAASPAPASPPGLADGPVDVSGSSGNAVVDAAQRYLGVPYRWGGTDPATGLDCSGFVQRVFADLGVQVPRVSKDQSRAGVAVPSLSEARPGDLVYWNGTGGRPNHIGIYLGGGKMMHAPRTGDVVKVGDVRSAPPDAIRRVV